MSIFILLIFFVLRLTWIPINADQIPILGISPCVYSGSYDESGYCSVIPIPVSSLPMQCTCFIYDGLKYVINEDFNPNYVEMANINALRNSGRRVFLFYTHGSLEKWLTIINFTDVQVESGHFITFLNQNFVSGIILKDIDYNYDTNLNYQVDLEYYIKLRDYMIHFKQRIRNLKIGVYVNASNIIYLSNHPTCQNAFNFSAINDEVDFYIIGFDGFNPCNDHFRGGIVPICGPNSLTTLSKALQSSTIAKEKIYLELLANPTAPDTGEKLPICRITYQKLCEDVKYQKLWCADNSDSFYNKGTFAKNTIKAQGIVVKYIDTIDPEGSCNCDSKNKFITFQMMLRGFTEEDQIKDCTALNSLLADEVCCPSNSTIDPIGTIYTGATYLSNIINKLGYL